MALATKATRGAVAGNGWTSAANATADDGVYATAAPAKNGSVVGDWDFAAFTDGEIPAGSTINSVTVRCNYKVSTNASVASLGVQSGNAGSFDAEETDAAEPTADTDFDISFNTAPSLTDVKTAGRLVARVRAIRGNSSTAVTFSLDYVELRVDYTEPPTSPVVESTTYRFRNDDGSETTATWKAAADTEPTDITPDHTFRFRADLRETGGGDPASALYFLQFSLNASPFWVEVDQLNGLVEPSTSPNVSDGAATTQQLTSGTFQAGEIDTSADDGLSDIAVDLAASTITELEWVVATTNAVSPGDTIALRVVRESDSAVLLETGAFTVGSGGTPHTASPADGVGAADAATSAVAKKRTLTDAPTAADVFARVATANRTLTEAATAADVLARALAYARTLADSPTVADSATPEIGGGAVDHELPLADTAGVADLAEAVWVAVRTEGDQVGAADVLARVVEAARVLAEAAIVADQASTAQGHALTVTDGATAADAANPASGMGLLLEDSATAADVLAAAKAAVLVLADGAAGADLLTSAAAIVRSLADEAATADVLARVQEFNRALADAATAADVATPVLTQAGQHQVPVDDTATATDEFTRVQEAHRSVADATEAADAATTAQGYARTLAAGVAAADDVTAQLVVPHFLPLADGVGVADLAEAVWVAVREAGDAVLATDELVADHQVGSVDHEVPLADTVGAADVLARAASLFRTAADTVAAADQAITSFEGAHSRTVDDQVGVADVAATASEISRAAADSVSAADTITSARQLARTITDLATVADTLTPAGEGAQQLADAVQAADLFARTVEQQRAPAEIVAAADQFARVVAAFRTVADTATVADVATVSAGHVLAFSDGVLATDAVSPAHAVAGQHEVDQDDPVLVDDLFDRLLTKGTSPVGQIGGGRSGIIVHGRHGAVTVTRGGITTGGRGRIVQAREGSLA